MRQVQLSGPTSFAPFIYEAMRVTAHSGNQFHLAVLIADGQVRLGFGVQGL